MSHTMSSSTSSDYDTDKGDEEEEDDRLPLPAALVFSQMELPDLTAQLIHETTNDSLDMHFPMAPERMLANVASERTRQYRNIHKKANKLLKEIKNLKRQNFITHCLLGTMIVLTLGWQMSEVSLILTLKNGLTHPFRSIGNALSKKISKQSLNDSTKATEEESSLPATLLPTEPTPKLGMKIPELLKFFDISKWSNSGNNQH